MAKKETSNSGADVIKAPREREAVKSPCSYSYADSDFTNSGGYNPLLAQSMDTEYRAGVVGVGPLLPPCKKHVVKKEDTLYHIALTNGVNLDALLEFNGFELLDRETGLIRFAGHEFQIYPGFEVKIPENDQQGIKQETANLLVKEAAKEAENADENHMDSFFGTLLDLSANYLGPLDGSKVSYAIEVAIPIAGVLKLKLSGGFEQKRRKGEVIEHKVQLGIGLAAKIKKVVDAEIIFSLFLQAASNDVQDATELFSYGFYKFGRQIADDTNDFGAVVSSSGASLIPSAALYYGLNIMYSDKEIEDIDDMLSPSNAENRIASMEAELFGKDGEDSRPFNETNPNEVAFGGSIKAGAEAENKLKKSSASIEAEISYQNVINAHTLNTTGIYGAQETDEQGFWEDYELGSKAEMSISLAGATEIEGHGAGFATKMTFHNQNDEEGQMGLYHNKSGWQFAKLENEITLTFKDLSSTKSEALKNEIIPQLSAMATKFIDNYREVNQKAKEKNLQTLTTGIDPLAVAYQIEDSLATHQIDAMKDATATDSLQLKLKLTSFKDILRPQLNLTIGILNEKKVDVGLVEGTMVRFTPASHIHLKL